VRDPQVPRCPTIAELPPPPPGKSGWPWTVETSQLPLVRRDGSQWPRISIVTPSYNQGQFIEETIRSVLLQGYANLEYIIMDGGSTDETVDIIKKYERWLAYWVSAKDRGQVHAINTGFSRATGIICNWINSDDSLRPGGLGFLATVNSKMPDADIISGARVLRGSPSGFEKAQNVWLTEWPLLAVGFPYYPQDSTFFSKHIWDKCGPLDERLKYVFDTAFFSKVTDSARAVCFTDLLLSTMIVHDSNKTLTKDPNKLLENRILKNEYYPQNMLAKLLTARFSSFFKYLLYPLLRTKKRHYIATYDFETLEYNVLPAPWTSRRRFR
jgi:glycosyltransferase involved in cell wall biosynthesis